MQQLRYQTPAKSWEEGLPIGNGKLGAMIISSPARTHLQCNEDSIWYGGPRNRNNRSAKGHLQEIQHLILAGQTAAAEELMINTMTAIPEYERHYEPGGDVFIENMDRRPAMDYTRVVDLATAVADEEYVMGETNYHSEVFASFPANMITWRLAASSADYTALRIHLDHDRAEFTADSATIVGQTGSNGVHFAQTMRIITDGQLVRQGPYFLVTNFTTVTLYTTAATTYRETDPLAYCREHLSTLQAADWARIKAAHVADYQRLYRQMQFALAGDDVPHTVPELLSEAVDAEPSPQLLTLLFNYGRYLLIASSRPGSLPANLQGIWNQDFLPAWDAKFTININTEMNYWIAEKCGLAECHQPLFDLLLRMYPNGRKTAAIMYGQEGFVAHHNTDLWGDTAPQDAFLPASYWPLGGAWLVLDVWQHYAYTQTGIS